MIERYAFDPSGEGRKRAYAQLMRETSNVFLGRAVGYINMHAGTPSFKELVNEISERKLADGFETRAYFLRACYEVAGGASWDRRLHGVGASVEMLLASMYHNNRVVDRKNNTNTPRAMGRESIAEGFNAFAAFSLIGQSTLLSLEEKNYIVTVLANAGVACMEGQFLDSSVLAYRDDETLPSYDQLEKRTYLVNAAFYEAIADIACRLGGCYGKKREGLITFGRNFGIAQQIVNDIADFTPKLGGVGTDEKLSSDAHADYRNGRLTLPIWLAFQRLEGNELAWFTQRLGNENLSSEDSEQLTLLLWQRGIIKEAQRAAQSYAEKAKEAIERFSAQEKAPFEGLLVVTKTNRYYRSLRDFARRNGENFRG